MSSGVDLGENKSENSIGHVGGEAGVESTAGADDFGVYTVDTNLSSKGRAVVVPVSGVVLVLLGCFPRDTHGFVLLVEKDFDAVVWNSGNIEPYVHVFILQWRELDEAFWTIYKQQKSKKMRFLSKNNKKRKRF